LGNSSEKKEKEKYSKKDSGHYLFGGKKRADPLLSSKDSKEGKGGAQTTSEAEIFTSGSKLFQEQRHHCSQFGRLVWGEEKTIL